jgi:hypothetical protein
MSKVLVICPKCGGKSSAVTALVVPQDQPFDVFECQWCDHVFADFECEFEGGGRG